MGEQSAFSSAVDAVLHHTLTALPCKRGKGKEVIMGLLYLIGAEFIIPPTLVVEGKTFYREDGGSFSNSGWSEGRPVAFSRHEAGVVAERYVCLPVPGSHDLVQIVHYQDGKLVASRQITCYEWQKEGWVRCVGGAH